MLLLLICFCSGSFFAAEKGSITLNDASGKKGDEVKIELVLSDNPGFISANLYLTYDTHLLRLASVEDGGLLVGVSHSEELTSPYSLAWINDLSQKDFSVNGTLATLTFEILDDSADTADIRVKQDIINARLDTVDFAVNDAHVTIEDGVPSDEKSTVEKGRADPDAAPDAGSSGGANGDNGGSADAEGGGEDNAVQTDAAGDPISKRPRYITDENGETIEIEYVEKAGRSSDATPSEATKDQQNGASPLPWILIAGLAAAAVIIGVIIYKRKKTVEPVSTIGDNEAPTDDQDH